MDSKVQIKSDKSFDKIYFVVQVATVAVFLGRAWQHLYWDAPFRTLLWDENLMAGFVSNFLNLSWGEYITSPEVNYQIDNLIKTMGWFYLICALVTLFIKKLPSFFMNLIPIGSFFLMILAVLYTKEKFYAIGQFFEYSLQFTTPLLFYFIHKKQRISKGLVWCFKILIALTFTCHGLYAINFYPLPGLFLNMTISILGVSEQLAINLLFGMGIMDFIVSIAILVLPSKLIRPFLIYIILWGMATSVARVWGHWHFDFMGEVFIQWLHEMVFRFPHFLIPVALYLYLFPTKKNKSDLM